MVGLISLLASPLQARKTVQEKLEAAIIAADFIQVKKYLRKLDSQKMAPQERKQVMNHLLGMSSDAVELSTTSAGFLNNRWDIARCIGGALVTVYALSRIISRARGIQEIACPRCHRVECNDTCTCITCSRNPETEGHRAACRDQTLFTAGPQSYSQMVYGIKTMPHYFGLATVGVYQLVRGLMGASQKSIKASSESINEFFKLKVGELES